MVITGWVVLHVNDSFSSVVRLGMWEFVRNGKKCVMGDELGVERLAMCEWIWLRF